MATDFSTSSRPAPAGDAPGSAWMQDLLLRHGPTALAVLDRDLRFSRVSEGFAELLGLPVGAYLERTVQELLPRVSFQAYRPAVRRALAGEPVVGVRVASVPDPVSGAVRHFDVSLYPETDTDGAVSWIGMVVTDVSDRASVERALRERDATLRLVLDSAPSAMLVVTEDGVIVGRNKEADRLFGYDDGELADRSVEDLVPLRSQAGHPALRRTFHASPLNRLMGHGRDLVARRKDGTEFPVEVGLGVSPERPGLVTCVVTDLTERTRAEGERAALLADAEAARVDAEQARERLTGLQQVSDAGLYHLSLDALLRELLLRVMRIFDVEVSTILLLDESGTVLVPTASIGLAEEVDAGIVVPLGAGITGQAAATRRAAASNGIVAEEVHSEVLRRSGVRSMVCAPLVADGELLGVQHVATRGDRHFSDADAEMLQLIADRVALAIDRARAYGREHAIAETLQQSLLPERLPELEALTVAVCYRAGAAGTKVGGDWYDVVPLSETRTGFVIGDVMGRGVRAAAVTGQLRHTARVLLRLSPSLEDAAEHLNGIVSGLGTDELTTVVLAALDTDQATLEWVSAGHPPPVVRRSDGSVHALQQRANVPLGATETWSYSATTVDVGVGDAFLFYTDGLVERRHSSVADGIGRLVHAVGASGESAPDRISKAVFADLVDGDASDDDVALLVCRVDGVAPASPQLQVPAVAGSLRLVRDHLGAWLELIGANEVERHELLLAVTEALTPTISAGVGEIGTWHVSGRLEDGEVCVAIGDPARQPPPSGSDRGRGLVMMEALVDELAIRRTVEGSSVRLYRRLVRSAPLGRVPPERS